MTERRAVVGRRLGNEQAIEFFETGINPYTREAPDVIDGGTEVEQVSVAVLIGTIEDIDRDIAIVGIDSEQGQVLLELRRGVGSFYTFLTGERPPARPYAVPGATTLLDQRSEGDFAAEKQPSAEPPDEPVRIAGGTRVY